MESHVKRNFQKKTTHTDLIYGTRAIIETILAGKPIQKIFIQKGITNTLHKELTTLIAKYQIPYSKAPIEKLNKITRKNHQGAVAFLSPIAFSRLSHVIQKSYENGKTPFVLILDQITDIRNFGAIARTAVCAHIDALIIPTTGSATISEDAMKASVGALAHLPVCREANLKETIKYLKESGLQIIACHEKGTCVLYETNLSQPLAIILGAEDKGIGAAYLRLVDKSVKIPMFGPIASLNVSVAAAIIIYESMRQCRLPNYKL